MKKKMFNLLKVFLFTVYVFAVTFIPSSQAQVAEDMGVTISPVKYEYEAERGEVITGKLKFFNVTNSTKTVYLRTLNFEPIGESGVPGLIPPDKDQNPQNASLKDWITLETDKLKVDPVEEDKNIPEITKFEIKVPEDAAAGGHYAAVVQSLKPRDQQTQTELEGSGMVVTPESACLIIVNVKGEVTRRISSEQFFVTDPFKKEKKPTKLFEYPPVMFVARVKNRGNTHVKPQGNIFLYKGEKQIASFKINEDEGNVLRESIRRFEIDTWGKNAFITREAVMDGDREVENDEGDTKTKIKFNWDGITKFAIGKYEAKLALVYDGNEGKEFVRDSVTFWIIPWKILLAILLIIILFVSLKLGQKKKGKKSRNKSKSRKK